jgi:hypothetical protein
VEAPARPVRSRVQVGSGPPACSRIRCQALEGAATSAQPHRYAEPCYGRAIARGGQIERRSVRARRATARRGLGSSGRDRNAADRLDSLAAGGSGRPTRAADRAARRRRRVHEDADRRLQAARNHTDRPRRSRLARSSQLSVSTNGWIRTRICSRAGESIVALRSRVSSSGIGRLTSAGPCRSTN